MMDSLKVCGNVVFIARFSCWALSISGCMLECMFDIYRMFHKVAVLLS